MPRGIYRRKKSPLWWLCYAGPRPDGSWGRIRESAKTTDFEKAKRLLDRRRRAVANHREGVRRFQGPAQERVTLGELYDNLEKHYETRKLKSLRSVKGRGVHIRRVFGFRRAAQVTRALIDSYIAQRRDEGAADATIDRETELIHRALTLGQEDGLVAYVPRVTHLVKGHANAKQGFVERAEFDALLAELPSQVLRDVAAFGYCTGMRKGEILSLTWDGYDHETKDDPPASSQGEDGTRARPPVRSEPGVGSGPRASDCRPPARFAPDLPQRQRSPRRQFLDELGEGASAGEGGVCLPRSAAHGGPQHDPGGRPRARRDGDLGPPDAGDLRPLQHRLGARPRRRDGETRCLRGGDVQGEGRSKREQGAGSLPVGRASRNVDDRSDPVGAWGRAISGL